MPAGQGNVAVEIQPHNKMALYWTVIVLFMVSGKHLCVPITYSPNPLTNSELWFITKFSQSNVTLGRKRQAINEQARLVLIG